MAFSRTKIASTLSLSVAAAMLTGCGGTSTTPGGRAAVAPAAAETTAAPPITADIRACAGVQGVIGHLAAETAGWSPRSQPFDQAIAARIRVQSGNLARQAPQAESRQIQVAVRTNAQAFSVLARSMTSHQRQRVDRAVEATKVAYRGLKSVCSLE